MEEEEDVNLQSLYPFHNGLVVMVVVGGPSSKPFVLFEKWGLKTSELVVENTLKKREGSRGASSF